LAAEELRLGNIGETLVLCRYVDAGCIPVVRNWHAGRAGELDLVVFDPETDTLIVAEVKTRTRETRGKTDAYRAADAVGPEKRMKIKHAAKIFLTKHPECNEKNIRFDVAEVYNINGRFSVEIFEDAF